jgi:hypothetical protein
MSTAIDFYRVPKLVCRLSHVHLPTVKSFMRQNPVQYLTLQRVELNGGHCVAVSDEDGKAHLINTLLDNTIENGQPFLRDFLSLSLTL